MRKLPRAVRLDLVAPVHRAPVAGATLLAAGIAAALALGLAFEQKVEERGRLDAELGARVAPRHGPPTPESLALSAESAAIERQLAVPWTRLLAELESASHDSGGRVSLLQIEPDPAKRQVRITAEVRAMNDALVYLRRLQRSPVLRHPMLESHERRKDDPDHPVRVRVSAEWRT